MVGKLSLGHTVRSRRSGWGRQVIIKTSPGGESAGYWVRPHPHSPLSLAQGKGVACTEATTEVTQPSQPNRLNQYHTARPGACHTSHIIPPRRICAT